MKATVFGLLIGWVVFNALATVEAIGRERKPVDPFTAVIVLVISAAFIAGLFYVHA